MTHMLTDRAEGIDDDELDVVLDRLDNLATRAGHLTGQSAHHLVMVVNSLRSAEFHMRIAVESSGDPRFSSLADRFLGLASDLAETAVTFGEMNHPTLRGPLH